LQGGSDRSVLVRLTAVGSQSEADIICAILRGAELEPFVPGQITSAMLPHLVNALNPNGVEILVPAHQLDQARDVLESAYRPSALKDSQPPEAEQRPLPCERYAKKALATAGFSWLVPLFLLLAIYYVLRVLWAPKPDDPIKLGRLRRHVFWAVVIGLPSLLLWATILWRIMRPDYVGPHNNPNF